MADPKKFVVFAYGSGLNVLVFYHPDPAVLKTVKDAVSGAANASGYILNDPSQLLSTFKMRLVEIEVRGNQLHNGVIVTSAAAYAAP